MSDNEKELALKKKAQKDFPEFTDAADGMDLTGLESKLMTHAKYREETEFAKKKDEELQKAKDLAKELGAPYRETLNALKTKMAYLHLLIEEKKATGVPSSLNGATLEVGNG